MILLDYTFLLLSMHNNCLEKNKFLSIVSRKMYDKDDIYIEKYKSQK